MCVITSYDTQKFNLHHGSFRGAKGMEIGCMNDLNVGVHHHHHQAAIGLALALFGAFYLGMTWWL